MAANQSQNRFRDTARAIAVAAITAAAWLLLSGEIQSQEAIAAIAAGLITAIADYALPIRTGHKQNSLKRWIIHSPRIFLNALKGSWIVCTALFRAMSGKPLHSTFKRYKFTAQSDHPEDTGRRVLATIGTTLQPNSYVVGYNREKNEILLHELVPGPDAPIVKDNREA